MDLSGGDLLGQTSQSAPDVHLLESAHAFDESTPVYVVPDFFNLLNDSNSQPMQEDMRSTHSSSFQTGAGQVVEYEPLDPTTVSPHDVSHRAFELPSDLMMFQTQEMGLDATLDASQSARVADEHFGSLFIDTPMTPKMEFDSDDSYTAVPFSPYSIEEDLTMSNTEVTPLKKSLLAKNRAAMKSPKFVAAFNPSALPQSDKIFKPARSFTRSIQGVDEIQFQNSVLPLLNQLLIRLDSHDKSEPIRLVSDVIEELSRSFPDFRVRFTNDFVLHARQGKSYGAFTGRRGIDTKSLRRLQPSKSDKKYRKLTPLEEAAIRDGTHGGMKDSDIAAMYGCSRTSVLRAKYPGRY
jgi:hypothetical protein